MRFSVDSYAVPFAERHHELIKFAIVGATTFVIDSAIFYTLKLTILEPKPVTAKVILQPIGSALALWISLMIARLGSSFETTVVGALNQLPISDVLM